MSPNDALMIRCIEIIDTGCRAAESVAEIFSRKCESAFVNLFMV